MILETVRKSAPGSRLETSTGRFSHALKSAILVDMAVQTICFLLREKALNKTEGNAILEKVLGKRKVDAKK